MATIHVDEIKALARQAHGDTQLRERLFVDMQNHERSVAVQAAWTLTHLLASDTPYIATHREELTHLAVSTPDTSLRRLALALLERIEWFTEADEVPDYYLTLLDFCLTHMMRSDEPYGVRALCMKMAYRISIPYPELLGELRQSLLMLEPSELGAGVRHTRNKLLRLLSS